VTDAKSGLIWQRVLSASTFTWSQAVAYCDGLTLEGSSSWRLPSITELESIQLVTAQNPAIDTTAFPNTPFEGFWSSTLSARGAKPPWAAYFAGPLVFNEDPASTLMHARCVR
jgi:hypothetical protein